MKKLFFFQIGFHCIQITTFEPNYFGLHTNTLRYHSVVSHSFTSVEFYLHILKNAGVPWVLMKSDFLAERKNMLPLSDLIEEKVCMCVCEREDYLHILGYLSIHFLFHSLQK